MRSRARYPRLGVFVALVSLLATFAQALPATAAPYQPGRPQEEPKVFGQTVKPASLKPESTGRPFQATAPVWPGRSIVDVAMPSSLMRSKGDGGPVRAAGLPVSVDAYGLASAQVQSFDRAQTNAAGVDGLLFRVSRVDGVAKAAPAQVSVDYNAFRHAYGGDWSSRLRLIALPECALTTPYAAWCRGTLVQSTNDTRKGTVSANVNVIGQSVVTEPAFGALAGNEPMQSRTTGGTLMALSAAPEGSAGDYKATSLSPSATWNAGSNTGEFSWSYALRVPPAVGGPAPSISLGYSSASVDGRMASANNQPSMIGEGFDWHPGYVERRYNSCAEDMGSGANNTVKTGDQCWDTNNATISFSGHAGELIKGVGDRWHLRADDGTRIERKTGSSNGDNDGEWWVATTPDGTQYWFGGRAGSNSTLVSTVFGNHSGEPCHQSTFAASHCNQAYRWQLDHVVDPHGNTMSFTYVKETNKYGRNNKPEDDTTYDRAGYLEKIEYGTRTGSTGSAPMQVLFTMADRCFANCGDKLSWPDVPLDQECTAATCGLTQTSPSFWTKKRLASIKTQVWGGSAYRDVETWTFTHSFPDPTDSITPALWLDKISHTGHVGSTTTIPDVVFTGEYRSNRVDTAGDQYPAMNKFRIKTITSESGGKLDVTYSAKDCVAGSRVPDQANLQNNNLRCYPVKWSPPGHTSPINDFFHKYVVTDVVEADIFGSSTRAITHYDYVGDPAWHYTDEDGMTKKEFKTWSVWRGYATVRTIKGDPGEQTLEERRYFRGMHGDKLPSGTRNVTLPAIAIGNIPAINDEDAFAGQVRETITYNGPGGAEVSASVTAPWQSNPTATRTLEGTTVHARFVNTGATYSRTALDKGRPHRTTSQTTQFDAYGMTVKSEDLGEPGAGDEKCTLNDYVRNTSAWITDKTARIRVFATDCTKALAGGLTDADVISDTKMSYDQAAWTSGENGSVPSRGLVSKTETLKAYNGGSPTYQVASSAIHDLHGRVTQSWDIRGAKITTAFTPATGGPVTGTSETSHLNWTPKQTVLEPAFGVPTSTTDVNGRKVDFAYDGLGRLTHVWLANRARTSSASIVYEYYIRNNAATTIVSKRLNPAGTDYITTYKLHDSLLRLRQTQEPDQAGGVGAVITDTFYDSAGRVYKTHENYLAYNDQGQPVAPSINTFNPTGNIPSFKVVQFDGVGRETAIIHKVDGPPASPGGTERWRTTTAYGGDRTDVTPPAGGTVNSTIVNGSGKTAERRDYHAGVAAGSDTGFDKTTFEYNAKDQLIKFTDAGNNIWQYKYDLQGRQIESIDPDKGKTTTKFNDYGDVESTTDGRGVSISYKYDPIGRKESMHDGLDGTGTVRAQWIYDTLANGTKVYGQLVKTIRHDASGQYIKEHTGYTLDYKPTATKHTIADPDLKGSIGSYTYTYTYNPDGSSATTRLPAMGDLTLEQLSHGYNNLGKPTTLNTNIGSTTYVANLIDSTPGTQYTSFGELAAIHLRNNSGHMVDVTRTYETDTRRVNQIWTTRQTAPTGVADQRFEYDASGNVTKISDLIANDHQCFRTDHLRQLKEAWTPSNGDCGPNPTAGALGGPSKYWHSFQYDSVGNRTELLEHETATGEKKTTYTVPGGKHQLTGTTTEDNTGTKTGVYKYDESGNMKERPTPTSGPQTMTWDAEGHLATSADTTGTTSFIYDVDGNRLIRKDPTGKTLYLPGQELRFTTAGGSKKCTRYYTHADLTIAMRTAADGIVWLVGDHHGTAQASIKAVGQAVSLRRETPFGTLRQTTGTWPAAMDKGFVGGTNDNTGLTHLGAREYDPLIGRFISVDPVIDIKDPQQMNGYNYANNAPVTASDADGLWPKWLDKAANKVSNAVSNVTTTVTNAAKAAGNWVYDNAGTISTVLGVAAMACAVIPPLQVAAPFLGAAATAVGAIETYKTCKQGMSVDCAMGMAELVPGGRVIGALGKGAKYADEVAEAAQGAGKRGDAPSAPPKKRGCHSFTPRTPVLMADGSHKAIGEINVGDQVVATDPETARTEAREVTVLHRNNDWDLTSLTVSVDPDPTAEGDETVDTLETTWNHPFWDATEGAWVEAADLEPGHRLSGLGDDVITVVAVDNRVGQEWMSDLTVADIHTYYVVVDEAPVLVHNDDEDACSVRPDGSRPEWEDNPAGPANKYDRRNQYSNMRAGDRNDALAANPTCVYCGVRPSTQADHIWPVKMYHSIRGWWQNKIQRSGEINRRGNLTGACQPCNGEKSGRPLGDGPGKWWPSGWPRGVWWPFGGGPH